ncbi:hypothetical protein E6A57_09335 [Lactobacillus crispatus]|nr:hypothetical protein E6A57_09335 [Lactobacillus crispatus]
MESTNSPKCMKIEHSHTFAYIFHSSCKYHTKKYLQLFIIFNFLRYHLFINAIHPIIISAH